MISLVTLIGTTTVLGGVTALIYKLKNPNASVVGKIESLQAGIDKTVAVNTSKIEDAIHAELSVIHNIAASSIGRIEALIASSPVKTYSAELVADLKKAGAAVETAIEHLFGVADYVPVTPMAGIPTPVVVVDQPAPTPVAEGASTQ